MNKIGRLSRTPFRTSQALRWSSSSHPRPGVAGACFPGSLESKFINSLKFEQPASYSPIATYRVMNTEGDIVDDNYKPVSAEISLEIYTNMLAVSVMDVIMFNAQRQGRLSFYMTCHGEEGIAVGSASGLDNEDVIFSQYREAGVFKQRGFTFKDFMAQLFANNNDPGRGRNMPIHYGSRALNIHTISSPLATQIPQAAGAAYVLKLQQLANPNVPGRVVACYFGEGAASEGDFHAALNIAATRSCPVIFICRNNGYAISTSTQEQYCGDGIAGRGVGYGISTIRVDGNDVLAMREVTTHARRLALEEGGRPVLIEAMSYRISHHSTSDDSYAYRARVEVEDWKRRDNPITRLRKYLEKRGIWNAELEHATRVRLRKEVLDALSEAERGEKPPLRSMFEDVYEEMTPETRTQMRILKEMLDRYPEEYDISEFEGGKDSLLDS